MGWLIVGLVVVGFVMGFAFAEVVRELRWRSWEHQLHGSPQKLWHPDSIIFDWAWPKFPAEEIERILSGRRRQIKIEFRLQEFHRVLASAVAFQQHMDRINRIANA